MENFYQKLSRIFRSGPAIRRRIKGINKSNSTLTKQGGLSGGLFNSNSNGGFRATSSPFSVLGSYGALDREGRFIEFAEMEYSIHPDTKIAIPGGYKTIKELSDECEQNPEHTFIVYSFDHNRKKIVPALGHAARKTCHDEAFRVVFDNGTELIGSVNHRLMKRDGTYCEIRNLKTGDAMMPFYRKDLLSETRKDSGEGYRWIYTVGKDEGNKSGWKSEHCILAEFILGRTLFENEVVHHKNFKAWDNRPENLEVMDKLAHQQLHSEILNGKKWDYSTNSEWIEKFKAQHSAFMTANNPAERKDITFWSIVHFCEKEGFNLRLLSRHFNTDPNVIKRKLRKHGFKNFLIFAKAYYPEYSPNNTNIRPNKLSLQEIYDIYEKDDTLANLSKKLNSSSTTVLRFLQRNGYLSFADLKNRYQNLKVIQIEPVGKMDLYDLTVDGYKNFATDSVISHNTAEISTALDLYADESCAGDEAGKCLHIHSDNPDIQRSLEDLFYNVANINFELRRWVRNLVKYGDSFLYVEADPEQGVTNVTPLPVSDVEREEGYDQEDPYSVRFKLKNHGATKILENWQVLHLRIISNDLFLPYGSCHEGTTRVLLSSGIKEIKDVKVGDTVLSFDLNDQTQKASKVLGVKNAGVKPCIEIKTRHNFIKTTKEHWILTVKENKLEYQQASNLIKGSLLVIDNGKNQNTKQIEIKFPQKPDHYKNKNGWWKNSSSIPKYVDKEFARLFGFLLGDGWIANKNTVCFANGVYPEQNEFYSNILKKYGNREARVTNKGSQTVVGSMFFVQTLRNMEFAGKATTKRIPSWVYTLSKELRKEFLMGFVDADGSTNTDKWNCTKYSIELANEELIKDLKILVQSLGWKSGQIGLRQRKNLPIINGRQIKSLQKAFYFAFYESKLEQAKKNDLSTRLTNDFIIEPIETITDCGSFETFDIMVDHKDHNFYANGIVTHNSVLEPVRKVWRCLVMMEDAMLTYRLVRSSERRVFYIDVSGIAANEVPNYMEQVEQSMRSNTSIDKITGRADQRFNPPDPLEDYFIPTKPNSLSKIDTLPAGTNTTAIEDVEYFHKKLTAGLKIPRAYLGYEEGLSSKASLSQEDIRFSRLIQSIQKILIAEMNQLAILHLFSKGFDGEDLMDFELKLSNPSTIAIMQKLNLWTMKFDVASKAKESELVDSEWIQKEILGLRMDSILKINVGLEKDKLREKTLENIEPPKPGTSFDSGDSIIDPFDPAGYDVPVVNANNAPPTSNNTPLSSSVGAKPLPNNSPIMSIPVQNNGLPIKANPTPTSRTRPFSFGESFSFNGDSEFIKEITKKSLEDSLKKSGRIPNGISGGAFMKTKLIKFESMMKEKHNRNNKVIDVEILSEDKEENTIDNILEDVLSI